MKTTNILVLLLCLFFSDFLFAQEYSWQKTHAKVIETGDLEWQPADFQFRKGKSLRYIDYENGNDANNGLSPETAWKHHPWDSLAALNSLNDKGADTYIFKRGSVYRGQIEIKTSGTAANPIIFTHDPMWGSGQAVISGSCNISGGWKKANETSAPGFPEPEKIWYIDLSGNFIPRAVWQVENNEITRIPITREPDWTVTNPDDYKSNWYTWNHAETFDTTRNGKDISRVLAQDTINLTATTTDAYNGATVWTEYVGVMGTPYSVPVEKFYPDSGMLQFERVYGNGGRPPIIRCRYFLENLPRFLDQDGEFYYQTDGKFAGRLYLRLPGDRNPNETEIEVAQRVKMIDMTDKNHIHINGLSFRFQNVGDLHNRMEANKNIGVAAIRAFSDCNDIRISNCKFEHLAQAIRMKAERDFSTLNNIVICDNDIRYTDHSAIGIHDGSWWARSDNKIGRVHKLSILRNRLYEIGFRPIRSNSSHAVTVQSVEMAEIAGNFLDRLAGAGLFVFGGKGPDQRDVPLVRIQIHHNKVTNPLLNTNDWGGIETWQNGPFYVYNNISGNPGGYWHWQHVGKPDPKDRTHTSARFGFAYYLDGSFKNYLFNNIGWGNNNEIGSPLANSNALQEIIGFMNAFFNNTFHKFVAGSRRQAPMAGRNYYLGNIFHDMSEYYFRHAAPRFAEADMNRADAARAGDDTQPYDYETLAYKNNIFYGQPRDFGVFEHSGILYNSLESFSKALENQNALADQVGIKAQNNPLPKAEQHNFTLSDNSEAIDKGVKFFVPWGLYAVVGEWNFYQNKHFPTRIFGEYWYPTEEYYNRSMYRFVPRNDLTALNIQAPDYSQGMLEDWTKGALHFNGKDQYCVLHDTTMKSDYHFSGGDSQRNLSGSYKGSKRKTADMDVNNFLIEIIFKPEKGLKNACIISKSKNNTGYSLQINKKGKLEFLVQADNKSFQVITDNKINTSQWQHVIAECDRKNKVLNIYLNGEKTASESIALENLSLTNTGDLFIAKNTNGNYFKGAIDYLRISRGSLQDAETNIKELYQWQFNGPFLKDFNLKSQQGKKRDAGAIEFVN